MKISDLHRHYDDWTYEEKIAHVRKVRVDRESAKQIIQKKIIDTKIKEQQKREKTLKPKPSMFGKLSKSEAAELLALLQHTETDQTEPETHDE